MKTNQAKAIAGIKYNLTTRADYARAERDCVEQIKAARKAGNDNRAAELSAAKSVFQKRARGANSCAACGVTIARGATHCRIHSRQQHKTLAAPAELKATEKRKGNGNARVAVPKDNLAPIGFYAAPVQKVINKWRGEIGNEWLEHFFIKAAHAAIFNYHDFGSLRILYRRQLKAFFELGAAIVEVCERKDRPDAWLIGGETMTNHRFDSWDEVRARIVKQGGKTFTTGQLAAAAKRLRLSPSKDMAKEFRSIFITKSA